MVSVPGRNTRQKAISPIEEATVCTVAKFTKLTFPQSHSREYVEKQSLFVEIR